MSYCLSTAMCFINIIKYETTTTYYIIHVSEIHIEFSKYYARYCRAISPFSNLNNKVALTD